MPPAECEIDNRIGVEVAQRDRARQGRTGQRRVDLGDFDRALGPPPDALQPRRPAPPPYAPVETEPIGAGPKIPSAVRDTPIEQRVGVAPNVEQTANVEP